MSNSNHVILHRIEAKKASRKNDAERLASGFNCENLQRENSILPDDFFQKRKISNFGQAVGR